MSTVIQQLIDGITQNNYKLLSRSISLVENNHPEAQSLLRALRPSNKVPVIGITGPPGAGKSSLMNEIIKQLDEQGDKVALLAIDPSSPFNMGALLGDRIRLKDLFGNPNIYIRSLASRGSLGGLSARCMEITDVLLSANFDWIFIETVGVGQTEIEIAGLADCTVLVLVPEAGDEIQTMKAGILEIADLIVVNKSDRPGADRFARSIERMLHQKPSDYPEIKVLTTSAINHKGVDELIDTIKNQLNVLHNDEKKLALLYRKTFAMIAEEKMKSINEQQLKHDLKKKFQNEADFNLYHFITAWLKQH